MSVIVVVLQRLAWSNYHIRVRRSFYYFRKQKFCMRNKPSQGWRASDYGLPEFSDWVRFLKKRNRNGLSLIAWLWRWKYQYPSKRQKILIQWHRVISQKTWIFKKVPAVPSVSSPKTLVGFCWNKKWQVQTVRRMGTSASVALATWVPTVKSAMVATPARVATPASVWIYRRATKAVLSSASVHMVSSMCQM